MEADPLICLPPEPEATEIDIGGVSDNNNEEDDCTDVTRKGISYRFKVQHQKTIVDVTLGQLKVLASRCLTSEGLGYSDHADGENWLNIVTSLSWEAALLVKPDPGKGRGMDPLNYVKVKCVASGSPCQSQVIKGLVFKKSAAHKHMPTKFRNAKLLLLKGFLGNSENELLSFSSMGREKDHLNSIINMIENSRPKVVFVEKNVSRDAQEALFAKGITVVFDLKLPCLERIALCTGSQILSLGDISVRPDLKHCDSFHFEKFVETLNSTQKTGKKPAKTLMFLEGCPKPLGCTILLKGANSYELKKIKHALRRTVFEAYHLKHETSFFADQRSFFYDINSLRDANGMPPNEMITWADNDSSLSYNSSGCKVYSSCVPPAYAVDIPISDGSMIRHTNGGQHNHSECAEGPLTSLGPSIKSFGDHFIHRNVSDNGDVQKSSSNVSGSVKKILEECFPSLTSESENERENDGGTIISPNVETFDHKIQLNNSLHEEPGSEFNIGRKDEHFSATEIQIDENTTEAKSQNKDHVESLLDSESIMVLTSRICLTKQATCEDSHLSRIKYYRNFDVSLGRYLQYILLSQEYPCLTCGETSEAHIYRYTHHNGSLTAIVRDLPKGSVLPGETEGKIWMWTRCLKCDHDKRVLITSRRVTMSFVAYGFSFGKFLDLSFGNHSAANRLSRCGHLLHKDCLRFFGLGSKVAMFRYSPVEIYTACNPQLFLGLYNQNKQEWVMKEANYVLAKGELHFGEVANVLKKLRAHFACSIQKQSVNLSGMMKHIHEIENMLKQDKIAFEASLLEALNQGRNAKVILNLNLLIKELHLMLYVWDRRLNFLLQSVGKFSSVISVVGKSLIADGNPHSGKHRILGNNLKIESAPFSEELTPSSINLYISDGGNFHGEGSPEFCYEEHSAMPTNQDVFSKYFEEESVPILDHIQEEESHPVFIEPLTYAEEAIASEQRSVQSCSGNEKPISSQQLYNSHSLEQWIWAPFSELRKDFRRDLLAGFFHKFQFINIYTPVYLSGAGKLIPGEHPLHFAVGSGRKAFFLAENEVSSIIACALASYHDQCGPVDVIVDKEAIGELDRAIHTSNSASSDELDVSSSVNQLIASDNLHPEITLGPYKIAGKYKYSVICLYAKEFRSLRKKRFLSELAYISSLSRCSKWDAKGGKSKVFFAKTMDEKFILKQLKKTELDSFGKFGPQYFNYLSSSLASGSQTCLAKILGIYQVKQIRNGREVKTDLMVMENLLIGRNITRKYDLKGAAFSRYVSDANAPDKVLLDENFIEDMSISPLYVQGSCKRLLERAIWNDTSFLTSINVMDYSLLVGIDRDRRELVFGIIDYVRQYTWDKQLETRVKSSLIVPKNELPTVVSPKEYRKRFRKFLSKYILTIPDARCNAPAAPDTHYRGLQSVHPNQLSHVTAREP